MAEVVGGKYAIKKDGKTLRGIGDFTYSLGKPQRKGVVGPGGVVYGFTEEYAAGSIEGEIVDAKGFSLSELADTTDCTVTLELPTGKIIACTNAFACNPEGASGSTGEGKIKIRFEGNVEEIR